MRAPGHQRRTLVNGTDAAQVACAASGDSTLAHPGLALPPTCSPAEAEADGGGEVARAKDERDASGRPEVESAGIAVPDLCGRWARRQAHNGPSESAVTPTYDGATPPCSRHGDDDRRLSGSHVKACLDPVRKYRIALLCELQDAAGSYGDATEDDPIAGVGGTSMERGGLARNGWWRRGRSRLAEGCSHRTGSNHSDERRKSHDCYGFYSASAASVPRGRHSA